jgi:hypothetical protein
VGAALTLRPDENGTIMSKSVGSFGEGNPKGHWGIKNSSVKQVCMAVWRIEILFLRRKKYGLKLVKAKPQKNIS